MTHLSPGHGDEKTQNSEETPSSQNNTEKKIDSGRCRKKGEIEEDVF